MERREQLESIGDYADAEGRLLAERGASKTDGRTFDMRACPYRDGRYGQAMNTDALRQIRAHWDDVLPAIRTLESDNRMLFGAEADPLTRLRRVTRVLGSLPEFLVLFQGTASGDIPVLAAVLYKIARGLNTITTRLTFDDPGAAVAIEGPQLYDYIERHNLLIGRDEVCAGPKSQIVDVLSALTASKSGHAPPSPPAHTPHGPGPLDAFLGEAERRVAVRYGVGLSDHLLVRTIFSRVFALFAAARSTPPPDPRRIRAQIAGVLALPCVAALGLQPPVLDQVMGDLRRLLSAYVTAGPAPITDALIRRVDALWTRTMDERRREVAGLAATLGVRLTAEIRITDIPERSDALPVPSAT